jgi:carboxyl-terminal processing protease
MKYFFFAKLSFALLFLLADTTVFSQTKYDKIAIYDKVWGFLKYHHPAVARGVTDWDSVYMNNIDKIQTASIRELNEMLIATIDNFGPIPKNTSKVNGDTLFVLNHNLDWVTRSKYISHQLQNKLKEIYTYRNQGTNKYIKRNYEAADYSGENKYQNMTFPDERYRLLFLARFWNAINYFAPYKYLIGEDWNNILSRFIPKLINTKDKLSYYKTMLQLAVALNDGHAQFSLENGDDTPINNLVFGKYTAPIYVNIVDNTAIVTKSANDSLTRQAGLQTGDIVLNIDNVPTGIRMKQFRAYVSGSNNASRNHYLSWILFDTQNTYEKLKIKRGNLIFDVNVKCILPSQRDWRDLTEYQSNETGYKTVGNSIAYVYAAQIWSGNLDTIKNLIKSKKAVIFDVRNYPQNDAFYNIFNMFLPNPKSIDYSLFMLPNNPGYFTWKQSARMGEINKMPYTGKVIVLADERNQSQGEYSVMCFQTIPGVITIGSQTAGADGVKIGIPVGGNMVISYSSYGVYYPNKTPTQRRGVKIDIRVKKTVESVVKGNDLILTRALSYLKSKGID